MVYINTSIGGRIIQSARSYVGVYVDVSSRTEGALVYVDILTSFVSVHKSSSLSEVIIGLGQGALQSAASFKLQS